MLTQVAEGALIHQSELLENNAVVVQGRSGVVLIDPAQRATKWRPSPTTSASRAARRRRLLDTS